MSISPETALMSLFATLAFLALTSTLVLFAKLRRYRIDLAPGQHAGEGESPFWQQNVLNRGNYSPEGKRLLRWLSVAQAVGLLCSIGVAVLWLLS
jgi:hypothetical protein